MRLKPYYRLFLFILACGAAVAEPERYSSPLSIVADQRGEVLYVGEKTARQIARISPRTGKPDKRYPLPAQPNGLAISNDGTKLYVTVEEPAGRVYGIDTDSGEILQTIKTGHTPMAPTLSPDEKTLYVCNRFNNNIAIIDLATGETLKTIPVVREPVAMALTRDGRFLFVANHLPTGAADVDYMTSVINVIDTEKQAVVKSIPLPNGAIDLREMVISPDGKHLYVPSIFARFLVPTTQIERGWINTHALNIIDVERQKLLHTVLLDDVDRGAANPWGVACSPDNKYIVVAHSATHEISIIDRAALMEKLAGVPEHDATRKFEERADNPMNNLGFLYDIRRRVPLKGNGPRNLVVLGNRAYITEYFSGSIGVVALDPAIRNNVRSVALGPRKPMDAVRKGEMYFNDAALCFQQWQSCATCHPDVRTDAVNWDLLNDGIGNPKSTKSLLLSHATPPAMITGIRPDAETAVRAGIRHIQFAPASEEKAAAIDAFLKSLQPIPSPHLVDGKLSEAAQRGKKIFAGDAGCSHCHSGKYLTNMRKYDVGTGTDREKGIPFDTPTLIEVWRTAPYLYDGRAATMKAIFRTFNSGDHHGVTSPLSEEEMGDLVEYVLSL
ncbi:MAG: beta-propeller fold lactonase family protein [Verrucomicrobia bacterium]|nr:beta-propeller fold lactonase family protein [Verrucomicrobiota bacterium]